MKPDILSSISVPPNSRRSACRTGKLCALIAVASVVSEAAAQGTAYAWRPGYPYRVWYGAPGFDTNPSNYANMTIVTAGSASPQYVEEHGKTYLNWAFGSNIQNTTIPTSQASYYENRTTVPTRTRAAVTGHNYNLVVAGFGMDEWIYTNQWPDVYDWIQDGIRTGRTANRDVFAANWAAHVDAEQLYTMTRDGIVDLNMMQVYEVTVQQGIGLNWDHGLARLEEFEERGLGRKAVLAFGHITDQETWNGKYWDESILRDRMSELKRKFPDSPGVAFFSDPPRVVNGQQLGDWTAFNNIVQIADSLSAEFWPDLPLPDGYYSITPQDGTGQRLDAAGSGTSNGTKVQSWLNSFPNVAMNQRWRFIHLGGDVYKIMPAHSSTMCLDVTGGSSANGTTVQLYTDNGTNAQKWKIEKILGAYRLSPLNAPGKYLRLTSTADGTQAQIHSALTDDTQAFSLAPEVIPSHSVPLVYQAEAGTRGGGSVVSNSNVGSMGGYVTMPVGGSLTFPTINGGGTTAVRGLEVRYANGDTLPRTVNLTVNGSTTTVSLAPTGDWKSWEKVIINRQLNSGANNTVTITSAGAAGPNFDKVTIKEALYQCEAGALAGGAYTSTQNAGSDGSYVGFPANNGTLTLSSVEGVSGGTRYIKIRFSNGFSDTRSMNLTVNGTTTTISFPPTGGWAKWQELSVARPFVSGANNTIVFGSNGVNPPGLDRIGIYR